MSVNQLFLWRRLAREGKLVLNGDTGFVPAIVGEPDAVAPAARVASSEVGSAVHRAGRIEIVLGEPRRVIVEGAVDALALGQVLDVLEQRAVRGGPRGEGA